MEGPYRKVGKLFLFDHFYPDVAIEPGLIIRPVVFTFMLQDKGNYCYYGESGSDDLEINERKRTLSYM